MRCAMLVGGLLVAVSAITSAVHADVIKTLDSAEFRFAYGATQYDLNPSVNAWSATENAGTNSPTTQSGFSFSPAPVGPGFSGWGPTFAARTLETGVVGDSAGYVGTTTPYAFTVPIEARYVGLAPSDASGTPNYKLTLEITNINIYGGVYDSSATTLAWDETTSGHAQTSFASVSLTPSTDWNAASSYSHLVGNPDDYAVSLGNGQLNNSFTRTFGIASIGANEMRYLDGLEVSGYVHLTYNAVPEPSTCVSLVAGLIGLLAYAWRRRK